MSKKNVSQSQQQELVEKLAQKVSERMSGTSADPTAEASAVPPPPSPFRGQEPASPEPDLRPLEEEAKDLLALSRREPERRNRLGAIFSEIRRTKRAQGVAGAGWRRYVEETFDISYKTAERWADAFEAGQDCQYLPLDEAGTSLQQQIDRLKTEMNERDEVLHRLSLERPDTEEEQAAQEAQTDGVQRQNAEAEAQRADLERQLAEREAELRARTPAEGSVFWTLNREDLELIEDKVIEQGPGWVRFEPGGLMVHTDQQGSLKGYFADRQHATEYQWDLIGSESKKCRNTIIKLKGDLGRAKTRFAMLKDLKRRLSAA